MGTRSDDAPVLWGIVEPAVSPAEGREIERGEPAAVVGDSRPVPDGRSCRPARM